MLAALEQGLDTLGRHVVVLDPHGRVEFASDGARRLLGECDGRCRLPVEVRAWISSQQAPRAAAEPLMLRVAGGLRARAAVAEPTRRSPRGAAAWKAELGSSAWRRCAGLGSPSVRPRRCSWVALGRSAVTDRRRDGHRATHRGKAPSARLLKARVSAAFPRPPRSPGRRSASSHQPRARCPRRASQTAQRSTGQSCEVERERPREWT